MTPLRGKANVAMGSATTRKQQQKLRHRNKLDNWDVKAIHRHPNFVVGDKDNLRGFPVIAQQPA